MKTKAAIAVVVLLVGGLLAYQFFFSASRSASRDEIETLTVGRTDIVLVASVSGTIEPHSQVSIGSRISGEIIEVAIEEGAHVEEGDVLFRLDDTDARRAVASAEADLARIRASLAQSRAELESSRLTATDTATMAELAERTAEQGLATADAARQARNAREVARVAVSLRQASVSAARAQLDSATLTLEEARRNLERTTIRAPFAGTILSVDVERGTIVSSAIGSINNTTLATLADLSDLRVIGKLDESQIGVVRAGQDVTFRVDAYPDRSFRGTVNRVSPLGTAEANVVVFDVEIRVVDPDASLLRSGMSADAEIVTSREEGVVAIPLAALRTRGGQREVVFPDGTSRAVRTGSTDGERIIVTEGLALGDVIVADALSVREDAPARAQSGLLPMPGRRSGSGGSGGNRSGGGGGGGGGGPR